MPGDILAECLAVFDLCITAESLDYDIGLLVMLDLLYGVERMLMKRLHHLFVEVFFLLLRIHCLLLHEQPLDVWVLKQICPAKVFPFRCHNGLELLLEELFCCENDGSSQVLSL